MWNDFRIDTYHFLARRLAKRFGMSHAKFDVSHAKFGVSLAGRHDAIFVVGALDETVMLRGMRYHPIDIENSVLRCHRKICEW